MLKIIDFAVAVPTPTGPPDSNRAGAQLSSLDQRPQAPIELQAERQFVVGIQMERRRF